MNAQNIPEKFTYYPVRDEFSQLTERIDQMHRPEEAKHAIADIFGVIRRCLSFEDSLEFINFLPLSFKAIYMNGWHVGNSSYTSISSMEEMIDEIVASPFVQHGWYNGNRDELREILKVVFDLIGNHIGKSVARPQLSFLPNDIQYFIMHYHTEADRSSSETSIWLS